MKKDRFKPISLIMHINKDLFYLNLITQMVTMRMIVPLIQDYMMSKCKRTGKKVLLKPFHRKWKRQINWSAEQLKEAGKTWL